MKVVDVVARCLTRAGADVVFGVVGSGNFTVTASLHAHGARFVAARHEGGAVCMADAYARVSGRLGVCSVHQGPGLTNAMTGLTEAAKSRTPLVVVAADTPPGAVRSNFRIDQAAMVEAVGAAAERVHGRDTAYADTMRAVHRATALRQTVVLNLPLDVQNADVEWPADDAPPPAPAPPAPAPDAVAAVADALQQARRPVILAGRGAVLANASAALERLGQQAVDGNGWRTPDTRAEIARRRWRDEPYDEAPDGRIDPRTLSLALDDLLPAERTVVVDSGHFMGWPAMYLAVPDPAGFVFTQSFQSIGLGLANAIGAAIARPDRLTVAALGDGGAIMGLPELETAARLRLPILFVIYDDAAYGAEVHHFRPMGHPVETVQFPDADFAALARGAGCEGVTVRMLDDLKAVEDWLERRPDRPLLVHAKVDPDVVADWLEEAF